MCGQNGPGYINDRRERYIGQSLKKCLEKGALTRTDPGFLCTAAITEKEIRRQETEELIDRFFGGRADRLAASLFEDGVLSPEEIAELRRRITEMH